MISTSLRRLPRVTNSHTLSNLVQCRARRTPVTHLQRRITRTSSWLRWKRSIYKFDGGSPENRRNIPRRCFVPHSGVSRHRAFVGYTEGCDDPDDVEFVERVAREQSRRWGSR